LGPAWWQRQQPSTTRGTVWSRAHYPKDWVGGQPPFILNSDSDTLTTTFSLTLPCNPNLPVQLCPPFPLTLTPKLKQKLLHLTGQVQLCPTERRACNTTRVCHRRQVSTRTAVQGMVKRPLSSWRSVPVEACQQVLRQSPRGVLQWKLPVCACCTLH
jgi:hypothetical protein